MTQYAVTDIDCWPRDLDPEPSAETVSGLEAKLKVSFPALIIGARCVKTKRIRLISDNGPGDTTCAMP